MSHNSLEYSSFVALPIWRSTWATDQSSGHRKIIVRPRAIPVGVHAPRIHLPRIPVPPKNRYPTCEESEEITSSFRTCNFFDWTVTMMRPQIRDCSIPLTSPRRRVWLPSRFGVPRSMTTFLSGGTVGVQIEEFLRNPDVLDHRFKVLSARKVFGSTSLNATISWPGYDDFSHIVSTKKVLCYGDLFNELLHFLQHFIDYASEKKSNDPLWKIGHRDITPQDIYLVGFGYSHCGYWTPVVEVEVCDDP